MEFNYLKTSVVSAMAAGALAFSASMMAAAPASVLPAEGNVASLESVSLIFAEGDEVAWTDPDTQTVPRVVDEKGDIYTLASTSSNLVASGNVLTYNLSREVVDAGNYKVVIPASSYTVNGEEGEACEFSYTVSGEAAGGYTVLPDTDIVSEIQNIKIEFSASKTVTLAEDLGTEKTPILYLVTEDGLKERRGTLFPSAVGSVMLLTMNSPIYDEGEYIVEIPGSVYFLNGEPGNDITLKYTIVAPSYPEVELSVNPAAGVVETLETIEVTFGGVDIVEWDVTGTENAPYLEDLDGTRWATFAKLGGLGNMLSLSLLNEEFTSKGEYKVIIPEGSYKLQGIYHGMPGKKIELSYEVLGLSGISVEPSVNVLPEIQYVTITFNEAKEVTLAEDLGTEKTPVLYLVTEDGLRERRGTFFPSVTGNVMNLRMNSPIYEEGEYLVVVPGSVYFLDGNAGTDIELNYSVVEPAYPEVDLSVNPATGVVETLETIEVTFGGVDIVEWAVTGTENAPYLEDLDGTRWATFAKLGGQGNMLSLSLLNEEFTSKGEYKVIIPEGSYKLQGIYHGMPGKQIELSFEVLGLSGISVEPAVNVLPEIQYVTITFNEAKEVTLAEDLGTEKTPILYLVTEDGIQERRGTFFPSVTGNVMNLRMNSPIYDEGEYLVVVPGSVYFLDGNAGTDIELNYSVVAPSYPEVDLSVNPASGEVETIGTIEVTFDGVDIVEWAVTGTENAPYLEDLDGTRWATFTKLGGEGNMLSLALLSDEFDVKGEYKLVIPEGSYKFQGIYHGMPGKEIVIDYNVIGLSGVSIEPATNILTHIQNFHLTFNEAKEVTLAEDLGTDKTPYLVLVTEEGTRERRGTLFPSVQGNNMYLTMNSPLYDEGEYILILPASCYFLDGVAPEEDLEFGYTIVAPTYPDVELSINPATDVVETLDVIEITFGGVDIVEWNVTGTENAPYLEDLEGNRWATFYKLGGQGNMLSLSFNDEFTVKGEYKLVIPEGSYVFQGVYQGMPGKALEFNYEVLGLSGLTVEPAVNILSELQNFKITFNEAKEVTLAEDLGTENTPYIDFVNEEGVRERRSTLFPEVMGNTMILTMRTPLKDEGEYIVVIPGTVYFLDGNPGTDVELGYTVVPEQVLEYDVTPAEGEVPELHTIEIKFKGDDVVTFWNIKDIDNDQSIAPTLQCDGVDTGLLTNLYSSDSSLFAAISKPDPITVNGYYIVTIPAASYFVKGIASEEIILAYILNASGVKALFGEKVNVNVYDTNGRLVIRNANASDIQGLRGIYVIDGKKYILR